MWGVCGVGFVVVDFLLVLVLFAFDVVVEVLVCVVVALYMLGGLC